MDNPEYSFVFEYNNDPFEAKVWHYVQLSIRERLEFGITENSYWVELKGPHPYKPFEVFIGEDLEWHTKSTFPVDEEVVEQIGIEIDRRSM